MGITQPPRHTGQRYLTAAQAHRAEISSAPPAACPRPCALFVKAPRPRQKNPTPSRLRMNDTAPYATHMHRPTVPHSCAQGCTKARRTRLAATCEPNLHLFIAQRSIPHVEPARRPGPAVRGSHRPSHIVSCHFTAQHSYPQRPCPGPCMVGKRYPSTTTAAHPANEPA
jgi:hypothetical protein